MKDLTIASPATAGNVTGFGPAASTIHVLTDLNAVSQKAFGSITSGTQREKITLRCDELPQVHADEGTMLRLFHLIGQMILDCSTSDSRLFIYVKSTLTLDENIGVISGSAGQYITVSICSNAGNCDEWKVQQVKILEECSFLCEQVNGKFSCLPPNQTGVLFSITLPGKLNTYSLE